jgi:hypothetical protein
MLSLPAAGRLVRRPALCLVVEINRSWRFGHETHAHAGVLMLSLAYFDYLGRAGYSVDVTIGARLPQPTANN